MKYSKVIPGLIRDLIRLPLTFINGGFTLIEILVVVLIIGILAAVAVPQYQRAVLKSRYAGLMPIAKAMADSNEAYYLEHGVYAGNAQDLPVQGRQNYPDGTELEFGTSTDYSYVLATRDNNFPNNYIVYQKHSTNYPGEIHCEALQGDSLAEGVCKSLGATQNIGPTLTSTHDTWLLSGTGRGNAPIPCPDGATCDDSGNITACASGQTLNNGVCEDCATAFPNATACSATEYVPTQCATGFVLEGNACEPEPTCEGDRPADQTKGCGKNYTSGTKTRSAKCTDAGWTFGEWDTSACEADPTLLAQLQAVADQKCPANNTRYTCTIMDGTVSMCLTGLATVDGETGECMAKSANTTDAYEYVYDENGVIKQSAKCNAINSSGSCYTGEFRSYNADGSSSSKQRGCADQTPISNDGTCASGAYAQEGYDWTYDSHGGNWTSVFHCSAVNSNGQCTAYRSMSTQEFGGAYKGEDVDYWYRQVSKECLSISTTNPTTCDNYKPTVAVYNPGSPSPNNMVQCFDSAGTQSWAVNADGSCAESGYTWRQKICPTNGGSCTYKTCNYNNIDWTTASC